MVRKAALIWIVGLVTLVPYATYDLFFRAPREQYALLITSILFWIFGYWGVVGPLVTALKVHAVFRAIEQAPTQAQLAATMRSKETEDAAIALIAAENRVPRFVAGKIYRRLAAKLATSPDAPAKAPEANDAAGS
jgi:hypothetical protein